MPWILREKNVVPVPLGAGQMRLLGQSLQEAPQVVRIDFIQH
jgi:hypothetical protein